jgi:DNA-binding transcriptional LysR family regulator
MEIADLKTLVSVVDNGSITLAAKELNRVPSGITNRILHLEESLGVQLFLREKKRLLVTPHGQELCVYAKKILHLLSEAETRLTGSEPGGRLRIGAMESTIAARLPEPLAKLHAQHADLHLEITAGTSRSLYKMLLENRLDAIFIADPPHDERTEHVRVFTEELIFVSPVATSPILEPSDIAEATVLTFKDGCSYRRRLLSWFKAYGMEPKRIAELTSYHAIMGGAAAGMGVGIVPVSVLELFSQKSLLIAHKFAHSLALADTVLFWRKGMKSANIAALLEYLSA